MERVTDFRYLDVHIEEDFTWSITSTTTIKKAQQRLYFLRVLRNNFLNQKLLVFFYRCSMESILTYCMCVWFASCTVAERKVLQRVVNTDQKIIGCPLPTLEDLYSSRCLRRVTEVTESTDKQAKKQFLC